MCDSFLPFHHQSKYSYSIYRWTSPRRVPNHASLCLCSVRWYTFVKFCIMVIILYKRVAKTYVKFLWNWRQLPPKASVCYVWWTESAAWIHTRLFQNVPLVMLPGVKDTYGARCCCRLRPFWRGQRLKRLSYSKNSVHTSLVT